MNERVERIRQLWGAANPDEHRAPQLIRDVQTLLAALAQAERVLDEGPTCEECGLRVVQRLCRQCHNAQCGVEEARAEVERLKREIDKVHASNLMKALNKAEAETERLREHVGASGIAYAEALRKRAEQAEARNRTLVEALRMCRRLIDLAETTGNGKYLQQAEAFIDAALAEPPPPICAGGIEPTDTWHPRQEPQPPQEEPR